MLKELETVIVGGSVGNLSNHKNLTNKISEYNELRNSIITYNNFYTTDELITKNEEANNLENEITKMLVEAYKEINKEALLASKTSNNIDENAQITTHNSSSLDSIFTFDYEYNSTDLKNLEKIDKRLIELQSANDLTANKIIEIETQMAKANSTKQYRSLQKQLQ